MVEELVVGVVIGGVALVVVVGVAGLGGFRLRVVGTRRQRRAQLGA